MCKRTRKRGQSIVEMALLFPLFLLIIVGGIVDFGFAFYNLLALQQLANDAASRGAEQNWNEQQITNYIRNYKNPPINWQESGIYETTIEKIPMKDGSIIKRVGLKYKSKTYTPFYQAALGVTTGGDHLTLNTAAAYKVPRNVTNR